MSLDHLNIKKEVNVQNNILKEKDNFLVNGQGKESLLLNRAAVKTTTDAFNTINADILKNRGLTTAEKNRIKEWSIEKQTFKNLADIDAVDAVLANEESNKYSDYYEEPGYFEKKTRRGAAEDSQDDIKKMGKVLKKEDSLDNRLEIIRLSGHAECETLRAQGFSKDSTTYIEARNRLLNRRIRVIEDAPGAGEKSKYKKLRNNAIKELKKNNSLLQVRAERKADLVKQQEDTDYVRDFMRKNRDYEIDDEEYEKLINKMDYRTREAISQALGILDRNRVDSIEMHSWEKKLNEENDERVRNGEKLEKKPLNEGSHLSIISPFLSIVKTGDDDLYDKENEEKAGSNTKLIKSYVYGDQDTFNLELEKNINSYLNFKLPFKLDELKGKEDQLLYFIPEMDKLSHMYYIFFSDKGLDNIVFNRFYNYLGIESEEEKKAFNKFMVSYLAPIYNFVNAYIVLAESKYFVTFDSLLMGAKSGLCLAKPNVVREEKIKEYIEEKREEGDREDLENLLDSMKKLENDEQAKENGIAFKDAYNMGLDMMQHNSENISIKDLAAKFKSLR